MDNATYKITLADGTVIDNLTLNGDNFISEAEIDKSVFENNCSPVIISDGTTEVMHENMKCVQVTQFKDQYWFVLLDMTAAELEKIEMQSNIDYIAMMTGVEL